MAMHSDVAQYRPYTRYNRRRVHSQFQFRSQLSILLLVSLSTVTDDGPELYKAEQIKELAAQCAAITAVLATYFRYPRANHLEGGGPPRPPRPAPPGAVAAITGRLSRPRH
ncbi:hypothetical protein EVAR_54630_1 [Eumeta japonica]|uniref:Uncharacterized protein n=1 Tax=Eumeta variegata TaxID=151549 RepID=A0A4C1XA97_EUMVA|nr:hypothetical protein EVAR_54630_1 [Eumeta japonica]